MTTAEAAATLGVTPARVRAMAQSGVLKAKKAGRQWLIDDASVEVRLRRGGLGARGKKSGAASMARRAAAEDALRAHELYRECRDIMAGCYDAAFLDEVKDADERQFCLMVSDFFLRLKQRELIAEGAY